MMRSANTRDDPVDVHEQCVSLVENVEFSAKSHRAMMLHYPALARIHSLPA
jgi:hypothetical protein